MPPFLFLPGVESSLAPAYTRMCKNAAAKNFSKVMCSPDRHTEAKTGGSFTDECSAFDFCLYLTGKKNSLKYKHCTDPLYSTLYCMLRKP